MLDSLFFYVLRYVTVSLFLHAVIVLHYNTKQSEGKTR